MLTHTIENDTTFDEKEQETIHALIDRHNLSMSCEPANGNPHIVEESEWSKRAHHWKLTLKKKRKQMTVYFSMGMLRYEEPNLAEVLECLKMDFFSIRNEQTFEDWASSLGHDNDSLRAYKSWLITKKQANRFEKFMGKEAMNDLECCRDL